MTLRITPLIFFLLTFLPSCKQTPKEAPAATPKFVDLAALAAAVPNTGPRTGNNYKVFVLVLRQNQAPAAGFSIDAHVEGKSEPVTVKTNESGLAEFTSLPFPDAKHRLVAVLHYFKGSADQPREISYPFIESDAYRLKDTQYIPNTVTPEAK